jgi:hypothetical protein
MVLHHQFKLIYFVIANTITLLKITLRVSIILQQPLPTTICHPMPLRCSLATPATSRGSQIVLPVCRCLLSAQKAYSVLAAHIIAPQTLWPVLSDNCLLACDLAVFSGDTCISMSPAICVDVDIWLQMPCFGSVDLMHPAIKPLNRSANWNNPKSVVLPIGVIPRLLNCCCHVCQESPHCDGKPHVHPTAP